MSWYKVTNRFGVSRRMLTIWENICKVVLKLTILVDQLFKHRFDWIRIKGWFSWPVGKLARYISGSTFTVNTRYHHRHLPFASFVYNCCCVIDGQLVTSSSLSFVTKIQELRSRRVICFCSDLVRLTVSLTTIGFPFYARFILRYCLGALRYWRRLAPVPTFSCVDWSVLRVNAIY
jgi:hypothetical protein